MSLDSAIEWTDATWNPVRGCSIVSAGCTNCYAMKYAHRFSGTNLPYSGLTKAAPGGPVWTGEVRLAPEMLRMPLRWKSPRRIFVNSMSDLFHEGVPDGYVDRVFAVMALCFQHTFQILTKRAGRMREYVESRGRSMKFWERAAREIGYTFEFEGRSLCRFPLPNVWLGVSVEDQRAANDRLKTLLSTPSAIRWVSAEPLLGPIYIPAALQREKGGAPAWSDLPTLDWVVIGGESGPGARAFDVEWARSLISQCRSARVPVFVKQLGSRVTWDGAASPGEQWPGSPAIEDTGHGFLRVHLRSRKGGDPSEWQDDLRIREYPR